ESGLLEPRDDHNALGLVPDRFGNPAVRCVPDLRQNRGRRVEAFHLIFRQRGRRGRGDGKSDENNCSRRKCSSDDVHGSPPATMQNCKSSRSPDALAMRTGLSTPEVVTESGETHDGPSAAPLLSLTPAEQRSIIDLLETDKLTLVEQLHPRSRSRDVDCPR